METLNVSKNDLLEVYKTAGKETKDCLKKLFPSIEGDYRRTLPVMERIKTFEDALNELGENNDLVKEFRYLMDMVAYTSKIASADLLAYVKLRIITAALNEGWTPKFTVGDYRWFPWFELFTKDELSRMSSEKRSRVVLRSDFNAYAYGGVAFAPAYYDSSDAAANYGSRLAFKSKELAEYAGKQFVELWADFIFRPKAKSASASK